MAKSRDPHHWQIGDEVVVAFPANPTAQDHLIAIIAPGVSYEAIIVESYNDLPRERCWTVRFKNPGDVHNGYLQWTCREKWLEPKAGPW